MNKIPGITTDGMNTFHEMVNPAMTVSQFGMRRSASSSQPCTSRAGLRLSPGRAYRPKIQTGLMFTAAQQGDDAEDDEEEAARLRHVNGK